MGGKAELPRTMTEPEAAWVAGLLEGEGWIGLTSPTAAAIRHPCISIKMTDEDVVRRVFAIVGAGTFRLASAGPSTKSGMPRKQPYQWSKSGREFAIALYEQLKPWLGERRCARFEEVIAISNPNTNMNTPGMCAIPGITNIA